MNAATLKGIRERKGLTQRSLAKLAGISHYKIWRYEHGENDLRAEDMQKVLAALGVSEQEFNLPNKTKLKLLVQEISVLVEKLEE